MSTPIPTFESSQPHGERLEVEWVDRLGAMGRLRPAWEAVRHSDPHATIFGSWAWQRGWVGATGSRWLVAVVRVREGHRRRPVAFLPLRVSGPASGGAFGTGAFFGCEIGLAGAPMADRSALLCIPDFSESVVPLLAESLQALMSRLGATCLRMSEFSDPRLDRLLASFCSREFTVSAEEPTPCPWIPLPGSFDDYLSGSRRRKALLRRAERNGFHLTHVDEESLERLTGVFLDLLQQRHGPKAPEYLSMMSLLLASTFRAGLLHLVVLWQGERPAAVNVGFIDHAKRTFHAYNGGWDDAFRKESPRRVVELHSIRHMIELGLETYDLGRGDEQYKFAFGAVNRFNRNAAIRPRTCRALADYFLHRASRAIPIVNRLRGQPVI